MACGAVSEFDERLLATVRAKDSVALEQHLSTVDRPENYLNRLYDEVNEQSCTLLMIACLNEDERTMRMLLTRFQPDLHVSNSIRLSKLDPAKQLFPDVTILWVAAAIDHFSLVKLLVEHGANVNSTTRSNSTPLRCACFTGNVEMARYLISQGADPQISKIKNDTNLMVSVNREHLEMATYLVDEVHCDVNECDDDGHSALHDAVNSGSLELVTFLLQRGARNFPAVRDRMSPLMWAAEKRQIAMVEAMSSSCSLLENIEAQELLASALLCRDSEAHLDLAIVYFTRALELRTFHRLSKPSRPTSHIIFDHRQECQTVEQLMEIRSNLDQIYTEALLVRERLLGPNNDEYLLSLKCLGIRLHRQQQSSRAVDYWTYELHLRQQHSLPIEPGDLRRFSSILNSMSSAPSSNVVHNLLAIIEIVHRELQRNKNDADVNLPTLLTLITIAAQLLERDVTSPTDRKAFQQLLHSINRQQFTTSSEKRSLLHLSVDRQTLSDSYRLAQIFRYPSLQTARLLLQCGAEINARDLKRNTPLHLLVSRQSTPHGALLSLLCDAGAHLDYTNSDGDTPADIAENPAMKQLLKSRTKLSLKCLCARVIRKENLPYHGIGSLSLVHFVEKH